MSSQTSSRLVSLTPDNHQPWLWFIHVLIILTVAWAGGTRAKIKWRHRGISDAVLLTAHFFYLAYWFVFLFALINALGKSNKVITDLQETKASKLLLSSRLLLILVISLEKLSTVLLIQEVFTKDKTRLWFWIIVSLGICQAFVGLLLISVGCSPGRTILPGAGAHCPHRTTRWIVFTTFDATLDILIIIPVIGIVSSLQTNLKNKFWAITVFLARFICWIPSVLHLVYFIRYIRHSHDVIQIVPTVATEEIWVCTALIMSSVPVLMRITKKFTTSGMTITAATPYASKIKESRTAYSFKMSNVAAMSGTGKSARLTLRPEEDDGIHTAQVDATRNKGEGGSIGSAPESQVGILRQVEFDMMVENK